MDPVVLWSICEISFTSSGNYANPFLKQDEPLLEVTFTHVDSGKQITVEGFWDGEKTWRVRFAPDIVGIWNWISASSDAGLNGKSGSFECIAPTADQIAENPNYRGHIKVHPSGRYFVYADGTPFFWIADTIWSMNPRRCGLGDNADGPFYIWLRNRKEKGFTVALSEFFEINQLYIFI